MHRACAAWCGEDDVKFTMLHVDVRLLHFIIRVPLGYPTGGRTATTNDSASCTWISTAAPGPAS
jgi:hypothetical protein